MPIIKRRRRDSFALIPNHVADDERLTFEARGVLLYLLAKPEGWQVQTSDLQRKGGIGRDKVLRIIGELETAGYIVRERARGEGGAFAGMNYEVHDTALPRPENTDVAAPQPDLPEAAEPEAAEPEAVNTDAYKEHTEEKHILPPTPQGGEGRKAFQRLWESWPVDHLPDNLEYALKQFLKLSDVERAYAEEVVDVYRRRCAVRGAHPRMIPYLKEKQFLDLVDAPEMDKDGDFIVTPKHRLEWSEWLGEIRKGKTKEAGDKAVAYHVSLGKIIVKTRWPDGFGRLPAVKE